MQSKTTPPAPVKSVGFSTHGTRLGADLRSCLKTLGYGPAQVRECMAWIEDHGSALGCNSLEPEDMTPLDEVIRQHTGHVEFASAAEWPSAWDDTIWALTDGESAPAPVPQPEPFEPSPEDRQWWASEMARLDAEDVAWLDDHCAALNALTRGLDDGRVTDHDMARSGAVG